MRWWVIDLPAVITTIWFRIIHLYLILVLAIGATLTMAMVVTMLVLYLWGIRWGW